MRKKPATSVERSKKNQCSRSEADNQFRFANTYNRSLLEASLDPLVTISPEGTINDVNESCCESNRFSRKELIGTDFSDYFTEPEKAKVGTRRYSGTGQ